MKKFLTMAFLTVVVMGVTATFISCNKDNNDDPNGGITAGTTVNPLNVFTSGLPKSITGLNIQTNAKGQVSAIQTTDGVKVAFEYDVSASRSVGNMPGAIMIVIEGKDKYVYNLYLNGSGFVKHCMETIYETVGGTVANPDNRTWDFVYNSDDQLQHVYRSAGDKHIDVKYQNGDIIETTTTTKDDGKQTAKIDYTSAAVSTALTNKGCLMFFDEMLGIDTDRMQYAYYAGMLGKATQHLPIRIATGDGENTFNWTLNAAGYPETLFYKEEGIKPVTLHFAW